jgi:glycosyltransferase involved in cell wall biosynthesis
MKYKWQDQVEVLQSGNNGPVVIAHLTRTPPFAVGSFTGIVRNVMQRMGTYKQVAISYWDGPQPDRPDVLLTNRKQLSWKQRLMLQLPMRVRKRLFSDIGSRGFLTYAWQTLDILKELKPKIVVCYDEPWMGRMIRPAINWPCRVVFSQHGLSYFMDTESATSTYSLHSFDSVWTLTNVSYRFDRAHMPYYEPTVRVVPNPIDTDRFTPASEDQKRGLRVKWGLPQDKVVIMFLAVLRPKKGAHLLIQSWPEVLKTSPNAFLWIVGGGDKKYEKYLGDLVRALGIQDSVKFQGRVPHEETHTCFQSSDIYAFPTLFVEGMPLSLGEALACGLPCVASEHSVALEAYNCDAVEYVPDPNLENAFVGPLTRLLESPRLREMLGRTARNYLVTNYSYESVLPQVERAFSLELALVNGSK